MRIARRLVYSVCLLSLAALPALCGHAQVPGSDAPTYTRVCTIYFDKDVKRPARVEDSALGCLQQAQHMLAKSAGAKLVLVATADRVKDNQAGHGEEREEQDMSGEDLRYADVAAYRAVNTKAYLVQWMKVNAKLIVPMTAYRDQDGQWLEIDLVPRGVDFRATYDKATAPILSKPCTVAPCATHDEEFLLAQPRGRIVQHAK